MALNGKLDVMHVVICGDLHLARARCLSLFRFVGVLLFALTKGRADLSRAVDDFACSVYDGRQASSVVAVSLSHSLSWCGLSFDFVSSPGITRRSLGLSFDFVSFDH